MPGYSLFRIEVIGAAHQYIVVGATCQEIPVRPRADRPAVILKTDKAGHIDELVRKQLVVAVLADQDIVLAPACGDIAASQGREPIVECSAVHQVIIAASIEQIAAIAGAFGILNHVAKIVVPDLHARFHEIDVERLEIADDGAEGGWRSGREGGEIAQRDPILTGRVVLDREQVVDDQVRAGLQKRQRTSVDGFASSASSLHPSSFTQ